MTVTAPTAARKRRDFQPFGDVQRVRFDFVQQRVDQAERDEDDHAQDQQLRSPGLVGAADVGVDAEQPLAPTHRPPRPGRPRRRRPAGTRPRRSSSILARVRCRDLAQFPELGDEDFFGALPVPMVVLGAAEPVDVLDDRVLVAELDVTVTTGAAIELPRDPADQPGLVTLFGDPLEAPSHAWLSVELAHGADDFSLDPNRTRRESGRPGEILARDQDRDEIPLNSKAFPTTSRSVSTSFRAPRKTWPAT